MTERVRVVVCDIAALEIEAVLRSVGSDLEPVDSVGRQIELRAGSAITVRLARLGELPPGGAVVTPAGGVPADFLIHVVVRSRDEPVTETNLHRALLNGLRRAAELEIERVALPPMGTGAGNLEAEVSASTIIRTLREHFLLARHPSEVVIAVSNAYEQDVFQREADRGEAPGEAS